MKIETPDMNKFLLYFIRVCTFLLLFYIGEYYIDRILGSPEHERIHGVGWGILLFVLFVSPVSYKKLEKGLNQKPQALPFFIAAMGASTLMALVRELVHEDQFSFLLFLFDLLELLIFCYLPRWQKAVGNPKFII